MKEAEEDMVHAYLEKSKLENEEIEIIKQRALKAQEEFEALERKRNENKELHDKMKEEIKKNGSGNSPLFLIHKENEK